MTKFRFLFRAINKSRLAPFRINYYFELNLMFRRFKTLSNMHILFVLSCLLASKFTLCSLVPSSFRSNPPQDPIEYLWKGIDSPLGEFDQVLNPNTTPIANPLSEQDYMSFLKNYNFYGRWASSDRVSRPFQNYFYNPFGLIIVEALSADLAQGGNYLAKLPGLSKASIGFHSTIKHLVSYKNFVSKQTWSFLIKIYDGNYVDQNSANIFYQVFNESAINFDSENATLSVTNGQIDTYLKDDKGNAMFYMRCLANFSLYFGQKSNMLPFKDILGYSSDIGLQFSLVSPDCGLDFVSEIMTTDGFQDSFQIKFYAFVATTIAIMQILGAYKMTNQLKSRRAVYKLSVGSMWLIATVDYYMVIMNLVLIFAFSFTFIVPFLLYMFLTFYLERDIILRIIQVNIKRDGPEGADENCRSCGFHFGISTLLFVFELVFILMSKLWVIHFTALTLLPQIFHNARRDKPYSFNFYHVFFMGAMRVAFIVYLKFYPPNIFRLCPDLEFVLIYSSLTAAQIIILIIQMKFPKLGFGSLAKKKKNRILSEDDVCPICMGDLKSDISETKTAENILLEPDETIETPCSHVFHTNCLRKWVINKVECPVCREKIDDVMEEIVSSEEEARQDPSQTSSFLL